MHVVRFSILAVVLAAFVPTPTLAQKKLIVAVFPIEDRTGLLRDDALRSLNDYLTTKVAERDTFNVIPSSQLRDRLAQEKKESYKLCYDERCHIEIGRELAAQKILATQIVRLGSTCAVLCRLYDLKQATTERSTPEKADCNVDSLIGALERAVTIISSQRAQRGALPPQGGVVQGPAHLSDDLIQRRRTKTFWAYASLSAGVTLGVAAAVLYGVGISRRNEAHANYLAIQSEGRQAELDRYWSNVEVAEDKITAGHVLVAAAMVGLGIAVHQFVTRPSASRTGERQVARFVPLTRGQGLAFCHRF